MSFTKCMYFLKVLKFCFVFRLSWLTESRARGRARTCVRFNDKDCELLLYCSVRGERTDSLLRSVAIGLCDIACCENWSAANTLLEGYPGSRSRSPGADT
jgi:hypothetical protein